MKFDPSVVGWKASVDGAALSIALRLQSGKVLSQDLHALHPARQAPSCENGDLDFGHVEPAAMFGGVMELDALQDASCFGRLKGFIEGSGRMGIEIVLHNAHILGMRVDLVHQPADALRVVQLGAMLGHLHMAPARQGFDEEKQIGGAQSLILVIDACWLSWFHGLRRPYVGLRRDELFIKADAGLAGIVLLLVQIQHIFHRRDELRPYAWEAPLLMLPGLELVFFSNWRMLSGDMHSTKPNSTALPASKRTVQRSWPVGAGLQVMAIRWAACPPVNAWLYRFFLLSCNTPS